MTLRLRFFCCVLSRINEHLSNFFFNAFEISLNHKREKAEKKEKFPSKTSRFWDIKREKGDEIKNFIINFSWKASLCDGNIQGRWQWRKLSTDIKDWVQWAVLNSILARIQKLSNVLKSIFYKNGIINYFIKNSFFLLKERLITLSYAHQHKIFP